MHCLSDCFGVHSPSIDHEIRDSWVNGAAVHWKLCTDLLEDLQRLGSQYKYLFAATTYGKHGAII